ncbi:MAG: hypothetical protein KDC12_12420 [Flavobacteriales bacterium]|nr:hypothetical protein [Flavobacteriales bacterium]
MKLRIRGNTVRLRLMQGEVNDLKDNGSVSEVVQFGTLPGDALVYVLRSAPVDHVYTIFSGGRLEVQVPEETVAQWAGSDEVSIEAVVSNGSKDGLSILIEKDFACLSDRPNEDDSDAFPNPNTYC